MEQEPEKFLYALCYEKHYRRKGRPSKVTAHIEYVHAENETHAKFLFYCMEDSRRSKLISAGRCIGHYCNEHGEGKTADVKQQFVIA